MKKNTVKKVVKHEFTPTEITELHQRFGEAYDGIAPLEGEAKSIAASYKAKIEEKKSQAGSLRASINAGYEMRDKNCFVVFRPQDQKKDFYLEAQCDKDGNPLENEKPVLTESMTQADFEQDLIQVESAFDNKKEIVLWQAGNDFASIIVGSLGDHWFSAVRGNVGSLKISERLDGEQRSTKIRFDSINLAAKRAKDWLKVNVGKNAEGFTAKIDEAVNSQKEIAA